MQLSQLLKQVPHKPLLKDTTIQGIAYDSRKVQPGFLFVCLRGATADGHRYAKKAEELGAVAILAEEMVDVSIPVIVTEDTRQALALVSAAWFDYPAKQLTMIGLTGTKGKTTTACMLRSILEEAGQKTGVIGTLGIQIGSDTYKTDNTTPESYEIHKALSQMVTAGCKAAVLEVSSIGLKAHRTYGISFDYGVFTNFSEDHLGGAEHKDMAEYLACKSLLFRQCKVGIINIDDEAWQGVTARHACSLVTYAMEQTADYTASNAHLTRENGQLGVGFILHHKGEDTPLHLSTPGVFNVKNALAACSVCLELGISLAAIKAGLAKVTVKGRVEPVAVPGHYTLLIDYAHNALSMENVLTTLRAYHPHRLICLFGAGGNRSRTRRFEMGEVSGTLSDLSVITADNSRDEAVEDIIADILVGMHKTSGNYVTIPDRKEAIAYCLKNAEEGDIIVLAGKGHEDYQEIHGVKYHLDEREVVADYFATHTTGEGDSQWN